MRDSAVVSEAKQDLMEEVAIGSHGRRWRKHPAGRQVLGPYGSHPFVTVALLVSRVSQIGQCSGSDNRIAS